MLTLTSSHRGSGGNAFTNRVSAKAPGFGTDDQVKARHLIELGSSKFLQASTEESSPCSERYQMRFWISSGQGGNTSREEVLKGEAQDSTGEHVSEANGSRERSELGWRGEAARANLALVSKSASQDRIDPVSNPGCIPQTLKRSI